ncbi:MAG: TIGR04053 family radical SAM/SPASM domain-containing protein [Candidatus Omnitrophica bacterium]|nr:TIGR04053 family radical SAM/SPASM domain-containing protein [Candidatus Omnitrophota bacterium]
MNVSPLDFTQTPFLVIWEMTRACALKCVHCRAEALDRRSPEELSTEQALALLREIRLFGKPLVVLTGGDPMRRPDILEIVEYGTRQGLRMAVTPSATAEMTPDKIRRLKEKGLARLAVSLDGSTAGIHDAFRRVPGSFGWTLDIIRWANEIGLPVQINTTVTKYNLEDLDALCSLLESLKIVLWSVFFLVPVGRGKLEDEIRGRDYEKVFHKMAALAEKAPFDIKSTEAPHYRRVIAQKKMNGASPVAGPGFFTPSGNLGEDGIGRAARGVNDGNGFVFVSHAGEIFPSGFLPLSAGNVKTDSLVDVYRNSTLFRDLRDPSKLKGKCGVCEYRFLCGGSRARAWAVSGDYEGPDPFCVYIPKGYKPAEKETLFF